MNRPLLTLAASALLLAGSIGMSQAQTSGSDDTPQQGQGMMEQGQGMMQQGRDGRKHDGKYRDRRSGMRHMMDRGRGYAMSRMHGKGHGMGHRVVMEIVFAIADGNGDGTLSLAEIQDIHARIFAHIDGDDDGQLTKKEIRAFFHGGKDRHGSSRWDRSEESDDKDDSGMSGDSDDDDDDD